MAIPGIGSIARLAGIQSQTGSNSITNQNSSGNAYGRIAQANADANNQMASAINHQAFLDNRSGTLVNTTDSAGGRPMPAGLINRGNAPHAVAANHGAIGAGQANALNAGFAANGVNDAASNAQEQELAKAHLAEIEKRTAEEMSVRQKLNAMFGEGFVQDTVSEGAPLGGQDTQASPTPDDLSLQNMS